MGDQARDLALPTEVPLADLLPAVLTQFGAQAIEEGADHEGWVVQRIGEPALDEDRSLVESGVLDGESLHLFPRSEQLAAIDYDDLVDGVAEQVREHAGAVTPARLRWVFRSGAVVALLLGVWLQLQAGSGAAVQVLLSAGLAFALLAAAALVARGAANPAAAVILAGAAAGHGALAGFRLVVLLDPGATWLMGLTGAASGALLALLAGMIVVADAALLFAAAILFSVVLLITGLTGSVTPAGPDQATAVGLVVSLLLGLFIPATAFRLSGLTLPMLPTGAEELHEDIDAVPHRVVVDRGAATFGYATALHVGLGLAQALLLPVLLVGGDSWQLTLALVIALLLVLRSRHPNGVVQRWALLFPAGVVVVMAVAVLGTAQPAETRLVVVVPLAFAAGLLLLGAERLPGRRFRPYWGRTVEIFELITAIAVLPILLQVLHVYTFMRNLAG